MRVSMGFGWDNWHAFMNSLKVYIELWMLMLSSFLSLFLRVNCLKKYADFLSSWETWLGGPSSSAISWFFLGLTIVNDCSCALRKMTLLG